MAYPIISADSHIIEPPNAYVDRMSGDYADRAPRVIEREGGGELYSIDGMRPVNLGKVASAGVAPEDMKEFGMFAELHRSGWDSSMRLADQDRDGVAAEVIYPTIGMLLCNHEDIDYKAACFAAYNDWLAEYCSEDPTRLLGVGQTAMRSPDEGIADLQEIKRLGLRGVMLPGFPGVEDYDSPIYDEFWQATIDLELPPSFHVLTSPPDRLRGPKMTQFLTIIRGNQDIMAMLVLGGVFERIPQLRVVCAEADAGWVPHFMYRMDHAYERFRTRLKPGQDLTRKPSEWFSECVYATFQDDWTAFTFVDQMNHQRLMWANDFPHSDSTWPHSQQLLAEQTANLSPEQREAILSTNAAELYGIDIAALVPAAV